MLLRILSGRDTGKCVLAVAEDQGRGRPVGEARKVNFPGPVINIRLDSKVAK